MIQNKAGGLVTQYCQCMEDVTNSQYTSVLGLLIFHVSIGIQSPTVFEGSLGINILREPPDTSHEATTFLRNTKDYCATKNTVPVCLSVCENFLQ